MCVEEEEEAAVYDDAADLVEAVCTPESEGDGRDVPARAAVEVAEEAEVVVPRRLRLSFIGGGSGSGEAGKSSGTCCGVGGGAAAGAREMAGGRWYGS